MPDESTRRRGALNHHEVHNLELGVARHEPRHQHVRVTHVPLLVTRIRHRRRDGEAATTAGVQEPREHRRRIEFWQTEKIDRAVERDERRRS